MELRLTVTRRGGRGVDVVLTAPAGTTLGAVTGLLSDAAGAEAADAVWVAGQVVPPTHLVGVAPVLSGARLELGGAGARRTESPGPRQVRVVGGPAAGHVRTLSGRSDVVVGRGADAGLRLDDAEVSRAHAVVEARGDGVWVRDAGSANGTWLDGAEVGAEPVPLAPGALLRCGSSLLVYTAPTDPPAATRGDGAGGVGLHRPPRLLANPERVEVEYPSAPPGRPRFRFPWVMVAAPLVIGGLLWLVTGGNSAYLLFTLLSPVMFAANAVGDRLTGGREHRRAVAEHAAALERAGVERDEALAAETTRRREEAPDPAALLLTVLGPGSRLWERRRDDEDALLLRLGTGDLPSNVMVRGGDPPRPVVCAVPVTVPLRDVGVLGLAGPAGGRHGLARWLVGQLAALHAPRDVRLVLLTDDMGSGWGWFGWLPHAQDGTVGRALLGVGMAQVTARVAELVVLLDMRLQGADGGAVVLVLDHADRLRAVPGLARLLAEGPAVGIFAVCLAAEALALPEECGATAVLNGECSSRLKVAVGGHEALTDVLADLVSPEWIGRCARGLAPVRDLTPGATGGWLPAEVRLLDLVSPDGLTPAEVAERWRNAPRSTSSVLGAGAAEPVTVDLATDGPHALVAGTTGAGKSELLQTLIAGLALGNRPDELNLILVDYKGGAAFAECARLPHTVGLVTDLDARLTARALESLGAELRRRERVLADAGAKDLQAYQAGGAARLPRLAIVVDEFASLVAELPDFVTGLVDIARRGRSLGVHLVLATQRPAGVVSAEIRANTALRICLRVTDVAESVDVVDAPDAARIGRNTPGRACARLADGGLTVLQTARVGGRPPGPRAEQATVVRSPWRTLGAPRATAAEATDENAPTDLAAIVDAVRGAAELVGAVAPPSPWLPPLPDLITVADVTSDDAGTGRSVDRVPLGLHDLPAAQRRARYEFDLAGGGHLMLVGGPGSGRTSTLRTLGAGIGRLPVTDAHLYALDCGSGGLASLEALPHCGAVVPRGDPARGERLLARIEAELSQRQEELARAGYGSLAEQRAGAPPGERLPWLVLLLDSWEGFVQTYDGIDHGRPVEQLTRLLREGPSAGLRVVLTGDRGLLTARAATLVAERLVLRMPDPDSYGLAGIPPRQVPGRLRPGRALVPAVDGAVTEVQLALLDADPRGPAQLAVVRAVAAAAIAAGPAGTPECAGAAGSAGSARAAASAGSARWAGTPGSVGPARAGASARRAARDGPMRIRALPERVTLAELAGPSVPGQSPLWTVLGVGGDDAAPVGLDLAADGPGALVAGPPGSGRSGALHTAALHHLGRGTPVAVVAARRSPLVDLAGFPGVLGMFGPDDGPELRAAVAGAPGSVLTVVDDANQLVDTSVDATLEQLLADGRCGILAAGVTEDLHATYRGFTVPLRRSRTGLVLCPRGPTDGDLLGVKLTRGLATRPGRGILIRRGQPTPIQVALPSTPEPAP